MVPTSFSISFGRGRAYLFAWAELVRVTNRRQRADHPGNQFVQFTLVIVRESLQYPLTFRRNLQNHATTIDRSVFAKDQARVHATIAELDDGVMS